MFDEADLDADLLAFEVGEALGASLADDHVVAVRIVGQHDHDVFRAIAAHDKGITVGHHVGVELASGKGVH